MSRAATSMRLLRARELPMTGKLRALSVGARLAAGRPAQVVVSVGNGRVVLARESLDYDWRVFEEVFVEGEYETDFGGATVVDVGAHKGYFSAYALARGATTVAAYEPEERNFAYLERAAASFGGRLRAYRLAVGAAEGEADLRVSDQAWAHSLLTAPTQGEVVSVQHVAVRALAPALAEARAAGGGRLLVKVDAEGAECELVLETAPDIWRGVDEAFVELHESAPCEPDAIAERLFAAGLRAVRSDAHMLHVRR
jgi:FkbM family methyltransferase